MHHRVLGEGLRRVASCFSAAVAQGGVGSVPADFAIKGSGDKGNSTSCSDHTMLGTTNITDVERQVQDAHLVHHSH